MAEIELRVFEAQNYETECSCLLGKDTDGYFDTHVYCPTHGQWWVKHQRGEFGTRWWAPVSESEVPFMIRNAEDYKRVTLDEENDVYREHHG